MALSAASALFYWSSQYDLQPVRPAGADPQFVRSTAGWGHDRAGGVRQAVPAVPRYQYALVDGIYRPLLAIEPARTNQVLHSDAPGTGNGWSSTNNANFVGGQLAPDGGTNAFYMTDANAAAFEYALSPAFSTGGFTYGVGSVYVKKGTASSSTMGVYQPAVGVESCTITWADDGSIASFSHAASTMYWYEYVGGGWYRVTFGQTSFQANNSSTYIIMYATGISSTALTGSTFYWRPQYEQGSTTPSSSIPTGASTTTRTAEYMQWPVRLTEQAVGVYWRGIMRGSSGAGTLINGARIWHLGGASDSNPRCLLYHNAANATTSFRANSASGTNSAGGTITVYAGQVLEVVTLLRASDGAVRQISSPGGAAVEDTGWSAGLNYTGGVWTYLGLGVQPGDPVGSYGAPNSLLHADLRVVRYADLAATTAQGYMDEMRDFELSPAGDLI